MNRVATATTCPWCGGAVEVYVLEDQGMDLYLVACGDEACGAQGPCRASAELAAGAWSAVAEAATARMPQGSSRVDLYEVLRVEPAAVRTAVDEEAA